MDIDEIVDFLDALDGVLIRRPEAGDGSPELAWGDVFAYYAPDGVLRRHQPFATVATKDYPADRASRLDRSGAFRVNVSAGAGVFRSWTGHEPSQEGVPGAAADAEDVVLAHPVYGSLGWLTVVNPGERTAQPLRELLRTAYDLARSRHQRRAATGTG